VHTRGVSGPGIEIPGCAPAPLSRLYTIVGKAPSGATCPNRFAGRMAHPCRPVRGLRGARSASLLGLTRQALRCGRFAANDRNPPTERWLRNAGRSSGRNLGLKGRNIPAQGNALGTISATPANALKGRNTRLLRPFRAFRAWVGTQIPRALPWAVVLCPGGATNRTPRPSRRGAEGLCPVVGNLGWGSLPAPTRRVQHVHRLEQER